MLIFFTEISGIGFNCVRGMRTQLLICVGWSVQLIREVFRDCICVDTHLPRYKAIAYVLPHCDALTHMVSHVSSALIYGICLRKAYISVCVCQGFVYFGLSLHIFLAWFVTVFGKCVRLLVHASMKPGCLARRPLCHKVNLPSGVVAQRPLCQKVSLPRCEAQRRLFILTCDMFGTGQTNI